MIEHNLDTTHSILYVRPKTSLEQDDFLQIAKTVDPYIEESGILSGLIIEAPEFAGWNNFGAVVAHFRFVREHHKHIKRVGLVPTPLWEILQRIWLHTLFPRKSNILLAMILRPPKNGF